MMKIVVLMMLIGMAVAGDFLFNRGYYYPEISYPVRSNAFYGYPVRSFGFSGLSSGYRGLSSGYFGSSGFGRPFHY
ncbi:hypothetical protein X975_25096, partial [Stegodyphus mimosarum]